MLQQQKNQPNSHSFKQVVECFAKWKF